MNDLDENVFASQRELLGRWRIRVRQIGHDLGRQSMTDENIIPLLLRWRRATMFTRDVLFFKRTLCHARYCLVWLDVGPLEVAVYARRLLRHPSFDTQAKRMGCVIRAAPSAITVWRLHAARPTRREWIG